jgi:NADH dehydrogenase/NADH:ubiquinone oxidoreductase subunit G
MTEFYTKDGDEFKKVEDTLLPQADVDKIVESRLDRQKKQFADYDDLKEKAGKVDTISKEWEEKLKAELGAAKLETVKVKAIHQFKLSDDLSEFLNGPDEKTILSQAEKLSKGVGGSSVVIDKNKKPEGDDKKNSDTKQAVKSLFGPSKSDD